MTVGVKHIDHVAITVRDLDRSTRWYRERLGLERRYEGLWEGPPIMLGAGETCVALFPAEGGAGAGGPPPIRMIHLAFRVDAGGYGRARDELAEAGIAYREAEHENCWSLYFADPDGHRLELTTYERPPGALP